MKILFFDFETTGLDPKTDRIVEIGAVLWDWERKNYDRVLSYLIAPPDRLSEEQLKNAGDISNEMFRPSNIVPSVSAFADFLALLEEADYWCGHNAVGFDQLFLFWSLYRVGGEEWIRLCPKRLLLDSSTDIVFPFRGGLFNLTYLAACHKMINPFPHRALTDALMLAQIVSHYDINEMATNARAKKLVVTVQNTRAPWEDGGKDTSELKANKFRWNPDSKTWFKEVLQRDILLMEALPFQTTVAERPDAPPREWWLRSDEPFSFVKRSEDESTLETVPGSDESVGELREGSRRLLEGGAG